MDALLTVVAIGLVVLVLTAKSAIERSRKRVPPAMVDGLAPYELAFLAGGAHRAANAVLAVLGRAGAIRVSRGALITPVYGAAPSPVPFEQAVLDLLGARPSGYRADELRRALEEHPAMLQLSHSLHRRGLLVSSSSGKVGVMAVIVAALAVFEVGVALLHPTLPALIFGAVALLAGFASLAGLGRPLQGVISSEGRRVLELERRRHPRRAAARASSPATGVALYGLGGLDDPHLAQELSTGDSGSDSGGSCGSGSSCSSSSSSCSSGSSCGSSS